MVKPLGEVLDIQNGYAFASSNFGADSGTPLIRIRDLKRGTGTEVGFVGHYDPNYLVNSGDFLIGMDGEFRCYEWKGAPALLNQRVCRLVSFSHHVLPRFLYYGINKYLSEIEDATSFTTVKHLSSKTIKAIRFPLPPLEEQQKIVAILDEAFEGLTLARAYAEANLRDARELFETKRRDLLSARSSSWKTKTLNEICLVERGSSPRPIVNFVTEEADGVNWIKIGDTKVGSKYVTQTKEKITKKGAEKSRAVYAGDFILTNSMTYGRPYIMAIDGYIHDGWFVLRLKDEINSDFFFHLLSSSVVQDQFNHLAAGSVVKNISGDLVKKVILSLPPIEMQVSLASTLDNLSTDVERMENAYDNKIADIDALRQSLLQKAFTGELT